MRYTEPQIIESGPAVTLVQGHPKPTGSALDSGVYDGTIPAYEADE
jgi:hypothetical protein